MIFSTFFKLHPRVPRDAITNEAKIRQPLAPSQPCCSGFLQRWAKQSCTLGGCQVRCRSSRACGENPCVRGWETGFLGGLSEDRFRWFWCSNCQARKIWETREMDGSRFDMVWHISGYPVQHEAPNEWSPAFFIFNDSLERLKHFKHFKQSFWEVSQVSYLVGSSTALRHGKSIICRSFLPQSHDSSCILIWLVLWNIFYFSIYWE